MTKIRFRRIHKLKGAFDSEVHVIEDDGDFERIAVEFGTGAISNIVDDDLFVPEHSGMRF